MSSNGMNDTLAIKNPRSYFGFFLPIFLLLASCLPATQTRDTTSSSGVYSLSGSGFRGQKHYLGWGAAGSGDPTSMQNETMYDVFHTHDLFVSPFGGSYQGFKLVSPSQATTSNVRSKLASLQASVTSEDMYVQYSSGHGYEQGLAIGGRYTDLANEVLKIQAKEIIVFTMACHSGGLVNAFDARRSEWEGFEQQGKTLLVMSSSTVQQTSSTGPGTDRDEQAGAAGTAGSAFGYSLWKALLGYSDGYVDNVKDGYISLEEILAYTTDLTQRVGSHSPVFTGTFNPMMIMNRVPVRGTFTESSVSAAGSQDASNWDALRDKLASEDAALMQERATLPNPFVAGVRETSFALEPLSRGTYPSSDIMIALVTNAAGATRVLASAPVAARSVRYCIGRSVTDCQAANATFHTAAAFGANAERAFYDLTAVTADDGLVMSISSLDANNQQVAARALRFSQTTQVTPPGTAPVPAPQGATVVVGNNAIQIEGTTLAIPGGWILRQDAIDEGTMIFSFTQPGAASAAPNAVQIFAKRGTVDLASLMVTPTASRDEVHGAMTWKRANTSKSLRTGARGMSGEKNVSLFSTQRGELTIYGYARAATRAEADQAAAQFLGAFQ